MNIELKKNFVFIVFFISLLTPGETYVYPRPCECSCSKDNKMHLDCNSRNITILDRNWFLPCVSIKCKGTSYGPLGIGSIDLSNNSVNTTDGIARFTPHLEILKIDNNPIQFDRNSFKGMPQMKHLSANNMPLLHDIPKDTFTSMPHLETVSISGNKNMVKIEEGAFDENANLTVEMYDHCLKSLPRPFVNSSTLHVKASFSSTCSQEPVHNDDTDFETSKIVPYVAIAAFVAVIGYCVCFTSGRLMTRNHLTTQQSSMCHSLLTLGIQFR